MFIFFLIDITIQTKLLKNLENEVSVAFVHFFFLISEGIIAKPSDETFIFCFILYLSKIKLY